MAERARGNLGPWLQVASHAIPPPLVGGGWGRGLAPAGAQESDVRDRWLRFLARSARGPRPQPPPTRGGGMQRGNATFREGREHIMAKTLHHWINGKLTEGTSGRFGDVFNPATGEKAAQVPFASAAEVDKAVGRGQGRPSRLVRHPAAAARPHPVQVQAAGRGQPRRAGRHRHRRARQDPQRRQGRAASAASRSSSSPAASRSS